MNTNEAFALLEVNWVKPKWGREIGEWAPLSRQMTGAKLLHKIRGNYRAALVGGHTDKFVEPFKHGRMITMPEHRVAKVITQFPKFNQRGVSLNHIKRYNGRRDVNRIIRGIKDDSPGPVGDRNFMPAPGLLSFRDKVDPIKRHDILIGGNHRFGVARSLGKPITFFKVGGGAKT